MDWQTTAALGVVLGVAVAFIARGLRGRGNGACGGGCGCAPKRRVKGLKQKK